MYAATAWDDSDARAWTVMGCLRAREQRLRKEADEARRRMDESAGRYSLMTSLVAQADYEDLIRARWHGGPSVLAFLFAHPDSDAIRMLDLRGDYFDQRTGDTWDLLFPGYYHSTKGHYFERQTGAQSVGRRHAADWYFSPRDFNVLRKHVEEASGGRWTYSGNADLVLVNAWLVEDGEPTIDWMSTISGELSDRAAGSRTLSLSGVIERISQDLERLAGDPSYGVGVVTNKPSPPADQTLRELMINALGGIAASLASKGLGL